MELREAYFDLKGHEGRAGGGDGAKEGELGGSAMATGGPESSAANHHVMMQPRNPATSGHANEGQQAVVGGAAQNDGTLLGQHQQMQALPSNLMNTPIQQQYSSSQAHRQHNIDVKNPTAFPNQLLNNNL